MDNIQNIDDIPIRPMNTQNNEFFGLYSEEDEKRLIEEEEKKPIDDRIISRFIDIKKKALNEISTKTAIMESTENENFNNYFNLIMIAIEDKNPIIQEMSLDVLISIVEKFEKNQTEIINSIFCKVIEKCYSSNKHSLNQKAKAFLVNSFQIITDTKIIFEGMKTLLESKSLKIPQITLNIISHILNLFGSFNIDYRGILPIVEKISDNASIPLRKEVIEFYKELYKWIRGNLKSSILKLKQNYQVKAY